MCIRDRAQPISWKLRSSVPLSQTRIQRAQACSEAILPAPQTLMASIPYRTLALSKCSASGTMSYCFCCAVAMLRTYKCPNLFWVAYKVCSTLWQIRNADECIYIWKGSWVHNQALGIFSSSQFKNCWLWLCRHAHCLYRQTIVCSMLPAQN